VDGDLTRKLIALCKQVGYFGVFEVEFIEVDDRHLMIDFNPRFYNQLRFDCDRGLSLPLLSYHAALGNEAELERLVAASEPNGRRWPEVFTHRLNLEILLRAQRLSGVLTRSEARRWRDWLERYRGNICDAAFDADDPLPAALDVLQVVYQCARHPRAFYHKTVMNH
jgi:predicted ATP-grasp superfamily ATP-dependent carboligase